MTLNKYVSRALFGVSIQQEYICVGLENCEAALFEFVGTGNDVCFEVEGSLFLGYKPLLLGFSFDVNSKEADALQGLDRICFSLAEKRPPLAGRWRGFAAPGNAVARLILRKVASRHLGNKVLHIFQGQAGNHNLLSGFHLRANRFREKMRRRKPDNVGLPGNLHDQVQIAYAVPRIISMVSLREASGKMNMFPTDLHGAVGGSHYVGSLRQGGKATEQIETHQTVALSTVSTEWSGRAYSLGKNHMSELKPQRDFQLFDAPSRLFSIPLPGAVLRYRELRRLDSIDIGIHRIHFYETLNEEIVKEGITLAHIHQFCAQWREDHQYTTEYHLR